jgi:hypothetical protein
MPLPSVAFNRWYKAGFEIEHQSDIDRLPLSESHCHPIRRRHVTEPPLEAVDHHVAYHLARDAGGVPPITSLSWQFSAKATRTISPFRQVNSSASEHQRMLERMASCSRCRRCPQRTSSAHASSSGDRHAWR